MLSTMAQVEPCTIKSRLGRGPANFLPICRVAQQVYLALCARNMDHAEVWQLFCEIQPLRQTVEIELRPV